MEQRLKERLTGAAILVALLVLIVPELFHGQAVERAGRATSAEGPPLRSYTIDLGGTHTAPMQLSTAAPHADTPSSPAAAPDSTPAAALAPAAVPMGATPAAPTVSARVAPRAARSTMARTATTHTHLSPASHIVRAASASPVRTAGSGWAVQLGLFARRANAEHMMHTAQAKGFSASLSRPDAKGRYRVRVAGINTHAQALTLAARLRAAGLPAATVGPVAEADPPRSSR